MANLNGRLHTREVGGQAVWSVTSAKAGNGVELLRDDRDDTYWQSDGAQPHLININFPRKVRQHTRACQYTFNSAATRALVIQSLQKFPADFVMCYTDFHMMKLLLPCRCAWQSWRFVWTTKGMRVILLACYPSEQAPQIWISRRSGPCRCMSQWAGWLWRYNLQA